LIDQLHAGVVEIGREYAIRDASRIASLKGKLMRRLLLSVSVLLVVSGFANAEVDFGMNKDAAATTTEGATALRPVKKWYIGGGIGLNYLRGWGPTAIDGYYGPRGYRKNHESSFESEYSIMKTGVELDVYAGYRLSDFVDGELGLFSNVNDWYYRAIYINSVGTQQSMSQKISAKAVYLAALIRPIESGYGHGLFFKLGKHYSELSALTTNNGVPIDTTAAGLGSAIPGNGTTRGYGNLFGIGMDFRTAKFGAVRWELIRYNGLGGKAFNKDSWSIGFNTGF
jgi:hypothetical protein